MKQFERYLLLIGIAIFLVMPMTSAAWEWDNVKTYDEGTKTVTITNALGLGEKIAEVSLISEEHMFVSAGEDVLVAEFRINNLDDYDNVFNQLEFYNLNRDSTKITKTFNYKYQYITGQVEVNDYEWVCTDANLSGSVKCEDKKIGSHYEDIFEWRSLDTTRIFTRGNLIIGIFTDVREGEKVEWIPTLYGTRITEWADFIGAAKYEYDETADNYKLAPDAYSTAMRGQTFKVGGVGANVAFNVVGVSFKGYKQGDPPCLTEFHVVATNASGGPPVDFWGEVYAGNVYANGTFNGSTLTTSPAWFNVTMTSFTTLSAGTPYMVVIASPECGGSSLVSFRGVSGGSVYDYGSPFHTYIGQNGTSWTNDSSVESNFQIWGSAVAGPELTITYPANGTNTTDNTIDVEYIVSDANDDLESCWYSNDSRVTENNITCGNNLTTQVWSEGTNLIDIFATDAEGALNRTNVIFNIDTSNPVVSIAYPANLSRYGGTVTELNFSISDATLASCYYSVDGGITNSSLNCGDNATGLNANIGNNTWIAGGEDFFGNNGTDKSKFIYAFRENAVTYNSTSYQMSGETFKYNLTYDTSTYTSALANLFYNGVRYAGVSSGSGENLTFSSTLTINSTLFNQTAFRWEIGLVNGTGTEWFNSSWFNQTINATRLEQCNSTNPVSYLNFTFKDDDTSATLDAQINALTWFYWFNNALINKTFTYINITNYTNYAFCFQPPEKPINSLILLQYSSTNYPQRRWTKATTYTNSTTQQVLYLLSSADGTYSVYQVQTPDGSPISGVTITAERQISGLWTLIEYGTTDSAGAVTFWLNPDYDHRITATKVGYTSFQGIIRPSSSTYTIQLSTSVGDAEYNNTMEGLRWVIYPSSGNLLNNVNHTFGFNITSTRANIVSCRMDIYNKTNTLGTISTGCGSDGGNLSLSVNMGNNTRIWGKYYVDVGEGLYLVEGDAYWFAIASNISDYTIWEVLTRFKSQNMTIFGDPCNPGEPCRQEYTRVVLFFFILFLLFAFLSMKTGWDMASGGGMILILFPIILIFSIVGWLNIDMIATPDYIDKYAVAIISAFFTFGWLLNHLAKS